MYSIIRNLDEFNSIFNQPTCHPMVGIGDLSEADERLFEPTDFDAFCVVLMDADFGELSKGGLSMRYDPGTIFTAKPGEILALKRDPRISPRGKMLLVRPEMIENTGLGRDFYMFNFFDFKVTEALKLTEKEHSVIMNCYANIEAELNTPNDELTGHMLRLGIGALLSYCKRFYERQFNTVQFKTSDFIRRLDALLEEYFASGSTLPYVKGYPTVAWCAEQFNLAPNYFGNIVRRDLHISAQKYIQNKVMEKAKALLSDSTKSIDQVAEALGFSYSNHFTRLFKNQTGETPSEFRKKLNKK
ncbi:MAG: helix-turn-helix domain-containing protein [Bacteroidales bacterium]|nr:helix-turn-helix domain-containing protein [Bacteroidales bacterium]